MSLFVSLLGSAGKMTSIEGPWALRPQFSLRVLNSARVLWTSSGRVSVILPVNTENMQTYGGCEQVSWFRDPEN